MSPWLLALSSPSAAHQSPSFSPPPPPSASSFSQRSSSHLFPTPRFSSDLVSHYLSEIKTTVPRIPQNLRGLRRGVRQEVVVCLGGLDDGIFLSITSTGCLQAVSETVVLIGPLHSNLKSLQTWCKELFYSLFSLISLFYSISSVFVFLSFFYNMRQSFTPITRRRIPGDWRCVCVRDFIRVLF